MQAAFASVFSCSEMLISRKLTQSVVAGALLSRIWFFGSAQKLLMWDSIWRGFYIHSSGQEMGRNGIGIDQAFEQEMRLVGHIIITALWWRVVKSYEPQRHSGKSESL